MLPLLLLLSSLVPQTAISGRAVDGESAVPLAHVRLQLFALPHQDLIAETSSNEQGNFEFANVEPGEYIVSATKDAYLPSDPRLPWRITVIADKSVTLAIALTRAATISGRAVDSNGDPLSKARVVITPNVAPATVTNELGDYRITGLPPASYRVTLFPGPASPPFLPVRAAITLQTGEEREGADFVVFNAKPTSISGRVTGRPVEWASRTVALTLFADIDDAAPIAMVQADTEGEFQFDGIPAAHYWLTAAGPVSARGPFLAILAEAPEFALQQLEVNGEPITDLEVPLQPGNTIDGVFQSDAPECYAGAHVTLETRDSVPVPAFPWADAGMGGAFRLAHVPPNRYRVVVSRLPAGCYVEEVRLEGRALPGQMLPPGADAHLEIKLSDHTVELEGTLAEEAATSLIVLAPLDESDTVQASESRLTQCTPDGHYRFAQLQPGRYRLMILPDKRTADYLNPAYWSTHPSDVVVLK